MKKPLVTRLLFAAAVLLLVVVNGLVLSRVTENATQGPVARVWLTERELPQVKWLALENSGVDLRIHWRNLGSEENTVDDSSPSWLRGQKLEELGFDFADGLLPGDRRAKPALEREVMVVLEYNGPAYHEALRRAERSLALIEEELRSNSGEPSGTTTRFQAKKRIRAEQMERSRLFVVNAGVDAGQLRKLYNESSRYIITRGIVGLYYEKENDRLWARGAIRGLRPEKLNLPLHQRREIERFLVENRRDGATGKLPRYEVEVVYGSKLDPWIGSVRGAAMREAQGDKE